MSNHPVGEHYLVELNDCESSLINSENHLREGLIRAVQRSGATIVKDMFHSFSPHGVTGVIVIAESHVSIHTWPELHYAAVDIFTCSAKMNVPLIIEQLEILTHARVVTLKQISRGPKTT